MKRHFSLLAAAVATLFSVGGNLFAQDKPETDQNKRQAPVVSKDADFAERQLAFTLNLFHNAIQTQSPRSNALIAPFSVYRSLAALSLGSAGQTKTEIDAALFRSDWDETRWRQELGAVDAALRDAPEATLAGELWCAPNWQLQEDFAQDLEKLTGQKATTFDFSQPNACDNLNYWISEQTKGKISKLIQSVAPSTRLLLADATLFAGKWKKAFDPDETVERAFVNLNQDKFLLPFMSQTGQFLYAENEKFQYLEAPYEDDRFSLVVVLPNENESYSAVERALTPAQLLECRRLAKETELEFRFPKFSVSRSFDLNKTLQQAGVVQAFGLSADLTRIAGDANLLVSRVTQGAYLAVDESGTVAEAATVAVMAPKTLPNLPKFYANRPFIYFIRHNADGAILFVGRLVSPEQAGGVKVEPEENHDEENTPEENAGGTLG